MILGIGVDILHLARLRGVIARRGADKVARRILSEREWEGFRAIGNAEKGDVIAEQTQFLGTRWAAKEALYKAAYPTYVLTWKQITLLKDARKPVLSITPRAPTEAERTMRAGRDAPQVDGVHERVHVSLSHDAGVVVAYVVLEGLP
ncbi:hypothetical protein NliqN6_2361 [Naganishia liquefaciens]|uniref:4'-phosphopantetheinyl transferase domain-containing protein n=1 Tax=Naganishia liquefaciens TaxID=104408 RepID=A0A8H3YE16_9TREE|nr:hypothetical protein NliqN6_2361 [Naganishia liquefaciens]